MAALDFPNGPTTGDKYPVTPVAGQPQYTWDGEKWTTVGAQVSNATPSATVPLMDATPGLAGTGAAYARGDHVHPTDTTRAAKSYVDASMVGYDLAQSTTINQKAQARANIGALKKNYVVNGAMMISQENGTAAGTVSGYYAADQFTTVAVTSGGTFSVAQVAAASPAGSPNRIRFSVTAADTSIAAGDVVCLTTKIEGLRCADLFFGDTNRAKDITVQFGVKAPAGTYCVSVLNSAINRVYVAEYVIAAGEANTDVVKSVVIPGDRTGTWLTDINIGLQVRWAVMCGATYQQAAGAWGTTTGATASANQFNLFATNGNVFELFDVSLTEGTVAPSFQVPDYASELLLCQRYFYKRSYATNTYIGTLQAYLTTQAAGPLFDFPVVMRAAPTVTASGSFNLVNATGGAAPQTGVAFLVLPDGLAVSSVTVASGLVGGNATMYGCNGAASHSMNARL